MKESYSMYFPLLPTKVLFYLFVGGEKPFLNDIYCGMQKLSVDRSQTLLVINRYNPSRKQVQHVSRATGLVTAFHTVNAASGKRC